MLSVRVIFDPTQISRPTAIALGNFDGVHVGHRRVIAPILPISLRDRHPNLTSSVVSFSPHPQEFFSQRSRSLLAPFDEKVALLESLGVEQLVLLPFDAELAKLTAAEFIQHILIDSLQVELISVGFDFHFGQKRQGNISDLQNIWGDRLTVIPEQTMGFGDLDQPPVRISSSNIRTALAQGEIDLANSLLGRPYNLVGRVVQGKQLGRTIGFPTANLELPTQKCFAQLFSSYILALNFLAKKYWHKSLNVDEIDYMPGFTKNLFVNGKDGGQEFCDEHLHKTLSW